jgi:hypothetical protein
MATIIENDPNPSRPVLVSQDSGAGWAVAILILVIVIVAGAFWYMRYRAPAASNTPGATVQVNLPTSGYAPSGGNSATPGAPNSTGNTSGAAPATQ